MGGGMLFVPLLHYVGGWAIDGALIAVSLTLTCVVSYGSGLAHRKQGHYNDEAIKSGLVGAVPGAVLGVIIVLILGSNFDLIFKVMSVIMLIWSIQKTYNKIKNEESTIDKNPNPSQPEIPEILHLPLRAYTGVAGMLSSILAIGAGVIYVPVLQQYGRLETRKAIGSSLHLMMVVVPVAIVTHLMFIDRAHWTALKSELMFLTLLPFLTYVGAKLGALFGMKYITSNNTLKIFLFLVVIVLVKYLLDIVEYI